MDRLIPLLLAAAVLLGLLSGCSAPVQNMSAGTSTEPAFTRAGGEGETFDLSDAQTFAQGSTEPAFIPEVSNSSLKCKRWYKDFTDTLVPRNDYGELTFYIGNAHADVFEHPHTTRMYTTSHYGLMTLDGTIVTDPVFINVYSVGLSNGKVY